MPQTEIYRRQIDGILPSVYSIAESHRIKLTFPLKHHGGDKINPSIPHLHLWRGGGRKAGGEVSSFGWCIDVSASNGRKSCLGAPYCRWQYGLFVALFRCAQYGLLARLCARYAVRIRRAFLMHNAAFFVHNLAPGGELLGIGITKSFLRREVSFRRLKYRM